MPNHYDEIARQNEARARLMASEGRVSDPRVQPTRISPAQLLRQERARRKVAEQNMANPAGALEQRILGPRVRVARQGSQFTTRRVGDWRNTRKFKQGLEDAQIEQKFRESDFRMSDMGRRTDLYERGADFQESQAKLARERQERLDRQGFIDKMVGHRITKENYERDDAREASKEMRKAFEDERKYQTIELPKAIREQAEEVRKQETHEDKRASGGLAKGIRGSRAGKGVAALSDDVAAIVTRDMPNATDGDKKKAGRRLMMATEFADIAESVSTTTGQINYSKIRTQLQRAGLSKEDVSALIDDAEKAATEDEDGKKITDDALKQTRMPVKLANEIMAVSAQARDDYNQLAGQFGDMDDGLSPRQREVQSWLREQESLPKESRSVHYGGVLKKFTDEIGGF